MKVRTLLAAVLAAAGVVLARPGVVLAGAGAAVLALVRFGP
jgi:hypothetical protein